MREIFYRRFKQVTFALVFSLLCADLSGQAVVVNVQDEDFNTCSATAPTGWTTNILVGSWDWDFNLFGFAGGSVNGTCVASFDDDAAGNGQTNHAELISPSVDVTSYSLVTLTFDYNNEVTGGHTARVLAWDGAAWVIVWENSASDPPGFFGFNTAVVDVTNQKNANFQVKYEYEDAGAWSWGFAIDNHLIEGNVPLMFDARIIDGTGNNGVAEYTQVPLGQTPEELIGIGENFGTDTLTNVIVSTSADDGFTFLSQSTLGVTLAATERDTFTWPGGFVPPNAGVWTFTHSVSSAEPDQDLSNNTMSWSQEYTDTVYSRDDNFSTFAYGIGGGTEGSMGNQFTINQPDAASGAMVILGNANAGGGATPPIGSNFFIRLWSVDPADGEPDTVVAESDQVQINSGQNGQFHYVQFPAPVLVQPGEYVLTIEEPAANPNTAIAKASNIWNDDKVWIRFPGNPNGNAEGWSHSAPFAAQFQGVPMVRMVFSSQCLIALPGEDRDICLTQSTTLGDNPAVVLGVPPYTYAWTPTTGLDNPTSPNPVATPLVTTTYTLTITDSVGCMNSGSVTIGVNPVDTAALFITTTDFCITDSPLPIDIQPLGGVLTGPGIVVIGSILSWTSVAYENGPLVNAPGVGAGGADESQLQNNIGMNIYGFGHQQPLGLRVADDFEVPYDSIVIDSIAFYAYQTGSPTTSTITGVSLEILDGDPSAGGSVIWGDQTTNQMINTYWSNIYRTLATAPGATNRPIMKDILDIGGLGLSGGETYWFNWATSGTLGSGPWVPAITIDGQTTTGNGLQFFGGWGPLIDIGPQGLPFTVYGEGLTQVDQLGFDPMVAGVGTHILTYCFTNIYGCEYCDTFIVTVHPLPDATITAILPLCLNETVFLTAATPLGVFSGPGIIDPLAGEFSAMAAGVGVHRVYYEVTDPNGCYNIDSLDITVYDIPLADAGADLTVCNGEGIIIGGNPTGLPGSDPINGFIDNYSWTPQTGLSSSIDPNPLASPTVTTTYIVAVQDNNGCYDYDTMTVTVVDAVIADAGNAQFACTNTPITIGGNPSAIGGTLPFSYSWSPANGLSDPNAPNPTANPAQATVYTLTVVDANGCMDEDVVTVTPVQGPLANAGNDQAICSGSDLSLGGIPTAVGGTPPYTYSWNPATNLSNAGAANPIFNALNLTALPVPYSYTLTVTDANGCSSVDVVNISLLPGVLVDAGIDHEICHGDATTLGGLAVATNGVPPYNYNWMPNVGVITPHVSNPTATPTSNTIYTITVTDANGCVGEDQIVVIVNENPIAIAGGDKAICLGTTTLIGGMPAALGGLAPYQYQWIPVIGLSNDKIPNPLAGPNITEIFTLVVEDAKGCTGFDETKVTVYEIPEAHAGIDKDICKGDGVEIGAHPASSNGTAPYSYIWGPKESLNDEQVENPYAEPITTTTYYLAVFDANNCTDIDSMVVTVNELPEPIVVELENSAITDICLYADILELTGQPAGGVFTGDGTAGSTFIPYFAGPGPHEITYTYTDPNGCVGSVSYVITVHELPVISAGPDKFIYLGENTTLDATGEGNYTYVWTPDTYLDNPNIPNPNVLVPLFTTTYVVTATDAWGCQNTDEATVFVDFNTPIEGLVPNTFTPNGDGINDTWVIPILEYFPNNTVQVYNRWGGEVFKAENYSTGTAWNGSDLPEGTYFWVIKLSTQGNNVHRGTITIVR